jgi:flavodoxin
MKKLLLLALALFCVGESSAQNQAGAKKILIAYFSRSGNTRTIAQEIQRQTGGTLFEIKTVKAYPAEYKNATEFAKKEQEANARPALASKLPNIKDYDVVFIGYPNWWGTMPMALFTFLETYDLSGKTVIPFCTHGGSRFGRSLDDLQKSAPRSTISEGLTVRGVDAKNAQSDISAWLRKNGIIK